MSEEDLPKRIADHGGAIQIKRIALTLTQAKALRTDPQPIKEDDTKVDWYREKYGIDDGWEIDALLPEQLVRIADKAVRQYVDLEAWVQEGLKATRIENRIKRYLQAWPGFRSKGTKPKRRQ